MSYLESEIDNYTDKVNMGILRNLRILKDLYKIPVYFFKNKFQIPLLSFFDQSLDLYITRVYEMVPEIVEYDFLIRHQLSSFIQANIDLMKSHDELLPLEYDFDQCGQFPLCYEVLVRFPIPKGLRLTLEDSVNGLIQEVFSFHFPSLLEQFNDHQLRDHMILLLQEKIFKIHLKGSVPVEVIALYLKSIHKQTNKMINQVLDEGIKNMFLQDLTQSNPTFEYLDDYTVELGNNGPALIL